ncbi:ABC transporter permease [Roseovarius sp. M141]|uniref:ABC transporter permease n=1 Tax=Roseovarius sp. M141 TaxID=2583806 RepID=UPI0020CDC8B1|nr:ABC transporter permease [Roseovarius sp. M141]MCQ0091413.1 ABC transporter permease [Roseovarius sp. M141]
MSDTATNAPVLAADGTPLKRSLSRALRVQKMRALALIAPLLIFVLISFILPIGDMLFRSVENQIVENTLPYTVEELGKWDGASDELPPEPVFRDMYFDLFLAAEMKRHTRLGSRLNYEASGMSSLFRQAGRKLDDPGKDAQDTLEEIDPRWGERETYYEIFNAAEGVAVDDALLSAQEKRIRWLADEPPTGEMNFAPSAEASALLPLAARVYTSFGVITGLVDNRVVEKTKPMESLYLALVQDVTRPGFVDDLAAYNGPQKDALAALATAGLTAPNYTQIFEDVDRNWAKVETWRIIQTHSGPYTSGYFLNAIDMQKTPEGAAVQPENKRVLIQLFIRTIIMSLTIMGACILLGYPVAWLLANLPMRKANILMMLVLLPFWTSLLVRTSAWKVMLQQNGVVNDVLVWIGLVADNDRLVLINNQIGTITAMTHILLPFMILPMYSVMQTINPSYLRAAKSLGATNWTAFWRVYFPQSIPGIGAGSILVFILSIGYYITPEIVGGTKGVFISNRIAYHISSSLNWGLAAALGTILLVVVLALYWCYDKIVGIDNVKLG